MRLSQQLWDRSKQLAESCLAHPFVRGLASGTLPRDRYSRFIAQDAFYLDVFARAYGAGIARAPDPEGRRDFYDLLGGVYEELKLHAGAAAELGIDLKHVLPLEATRAYTDFLVANAFAGTLGELVAAMTPCMRLYHFLGVRLAQEASPGNSYHDWIDTYGAGTFAGLVERVETLMDRYGQDTLRERDCYRRAMHLEYDFFDDAWRQ